MSANVEVFESATARDSRIPFPTVGQIVFLTDLGDFEVYHGAYSGWGIAWNVARGELDYMELAANTAELSRGYADVGLSVTADLLANRTYRITFNGPAQSSFEAQQIGVRITDPDHVVLSSLFEFVPLAAAGPPNAFRLEARVAQAINRAGATFTVQAYEAGSGVVLVGASAPRCSLAIEDIGAHGPPINRG